MSLFRPSIGLLVLGGWLAIVDGTGCTEPTPRYCLDSCPGALVCSANHACVPAQDARTSDAAVDGTSDDAAGGQEGGASVDGVNLPACDQSLDCTGQSRPICDMPVHTCVGCLLDGDCQAPKGVCDMNAKVCVQCLAAKDCAGATPVCEAGMCRPCQADSQCTTGPKICMSHQDGRCASDAETLYVQKTATCPGAGNSASPFCLPQDAVAALTGATTVMVLRGPSALDRLNIAATPASQVTVIGQAGASIAPGAAAGLHVSAGARVFVRGLKISGGTDVGVLAEGNAELRMDRCIVEGNLGGIRVDGARFDITNTIIDKNGAAATAGCGAWGGVCLLNVPATPASRFLNNTVAANNQVGVACDRAYAIAGSIVSGSAGGLDAVGCAPSPCCGSGDPKLDPLTFHLMAGSVCLDKLPPAMSVPYDIDGDLRPSGASGMSDCGADEYVAPPSP
jgi:hypothetical protein